MKTLFEYKPLKEIDLGDHFFDSLRQDYDVLMLGIDTKLTRVNGLSSYIETKDYKLSSSSKARLISSSMMSSLRSHPAVYSKLGHLR